MHSRILIYESSGLVLPCIACLALHCMSCLISSLLVCVLSCLDLSCQRVECWQIIPDPGEAIRDFFDRNGARFQPPPYASSCDKSPKQHHVFFRHFSSLFLVRPSLETVIMASLSLNCIELSSIPLIISLTLLEKRIRS